MGDFPKTQGPVPNMPPVTLPRSTTGIPFADEMLKEVERFDLSLSIRFRKEIYDAVLRLLNIKYRIDTTIQPATKETTIHE